LPSRRPLVLDANVLLDKTFMKWLEGYHDRKILPPIAYAEIAFAFLKKYDSTEKLDRLLHWPDIRVERMEYRQARLTAEIAYRVERPDWKKQFRDYSIAAYAFEAPTILVTRDKHNFAFLEPRVKDPYELMREFGTVY
jgi:predicted nucleic acid-binding protein